jgi:predicted SAM-dependent methyltransferase
MAVFTPERLAALSPSVRMLEMGCGPKRIWPHSTAIDVNPRSKADVVHDLNQTPWPFADNTFDFVTAEHVLEHLRDIIAIVEEVHRILKPGGLWLVEVPHFSSHHYHTDPTHTHAFGARSFDYFEPAPGGLYMFHYAKADFKKRAVVLKGAKRNFFHRWLYKKANRNPMRYESDLTWIFPLETVNFELETIK